MEFRFPVNEVFRQPIIKVGNNLLPPGFAGDRRAFWDTVAKVSEVVNAMGEYSAAAQGLTKPITTAERLRNSEHAVYLLVDHSANNGRGAVTGMLKTGKKGLYVFDRNGQHFQVTPPCVLDFYIHESRQRTGLGKRLFEHMLQEEKVEPVKMAIDRPSEKFLGFLNKHYSLNNPVRQMNNYVVFDGFFPNSPERNSAVEVNHSGDNKVGKKQSANGLQSGGFTPMGRYGAPRPPCSMGQIIHNQSSTIPKSTEPTGVKSTPAANYQNPAMSSPGNPVNFTQSAPNVYHSNQEQSFKLDGLASQGGQAIQNYANSANQNINSGYYSNTTQNAGFIQPQQYGSDQYSQGAAGIPYGMQQPNQMEAGQNAYAAQGNYAPQAAPQTFNPTQNMQINESNQYGQYPHWQQRVQNTMSQPQMPNVAPQQMLQAQMQKAVPQVAPQYMQEPVPQYIQSATQQAGRPHPQLATQHAVPQYSQSTTQQVMPQQQTLEPNAPVSTQSSKMVPQPMAGDVSDKQQAQYQQPYAAMQQVASVPQFANNANVNAATAPQYASSVPNIQYQSNNQNALNPNVVPQYNIQNQSDKQNALNANVVPQYHLQNQSDKQNALNSNVVPQYNLQNQSDKQNALNPNVVPQYHLQNQSDKQNALNVNVVPQYNLQNQSDKQNALNANVVPQYNVQNQSDKQNALNANVAPQYNAYNQSDKQNVMNANVVPQYNLQNQSDKRNALNPHYGVQGAQNNMPPMIPSGTNMRINNQAYQNMPQTAAPMNTHMAYQQNAQYEIHAQGDQGNIEGSHLNKNVMNEPVPARNAKGDTGPVDEITPVKFGYPPQSHIPESQVKEEESVNSSPKLERPRSLSIQLSEEQPEEKQNDDVESEVLAKEVTLTEELIEDLVISNEENPTAESIPDGNKSPLNRKPSHLTEQGFFDLKFYHNKLW